MKNDLKIDFVIPWVDGNDPAWQAEKAEFAPTREDDSNSVNRYRDWGLLPYWFRAVEKFTPWVNRIHFITWGHLPAFLNTEHPKLHVVRHEDYIPGEYLPTFSANPIEMNMHRIEGLSENFVYFNDDMFLLRPMEEERFFRAGQPCVYGVESPIILGSREVWQYLLVNDIAVLNGHFSKKEFLKKELGRLWLTDYTLVDKIRATSTGVLFPQAFLGFKNIHAPASFLKETFAAIWREEPQLLDATSKNRFRSMTDVNQWLPLWWQVLSGNYVPHRIDNAIVPASEKNLSRLTEIITHQSHDMICINDPTDNLDFETLSAKLQSAFETILPEKCSFEK